MEELEASCPECSARIMPENFNVSTDYAYCASCKKIFRFSEVITGNTKFYPLDKMPSRMKVREDFDYYSVYAPYPKLILLFLVPFTAVWSGFSMGGLYIQPLLQGKLPWGQFLFGIPFLIGTVVLLSIIIASLGGVKVIIDGEGRGIIRSGFSFLAWKKRFDINDVSEIDVTVKHGNETKSELLDMKLKSGSKISFGTGLRSDDLHYMKALLSSRILKRKKK